jgi:hypothetical protein
VEELNDADCIVVAALVHVDEKSVDAWAAVAVAVADVKVRAAGLLHLNEKL